MASAQELDRLNRVLSRIKGRIRTLSTTLSKGDLPESRILYVIVKGQYLEKQVGKVRGKVLNDDETKKLAHDIQEILQAAYGRLRQQSGTKGLTPDTVESHGRGGARFLIPKQQLEFFARFGMSAQMMAETLNVSDGTIRGRLREYGIKLREKFSDISDKELDQLIRGFLSSGNVGAKVVRARLQERGLVVQRQRIRAAMLRVDPDGVALRAQRPGLLRLADAMAEGKLDKNGAQKNKSHTDEKGNIVLTWILLPRPKEKFCMKEMHRYRVVSNEFYKKKTMCIAPDATCNQVIKHLLDMFPCLRGEEFSINKLDGKNAFHQIEPQPRNALHLKNFQFSVAGSNNSMLWVMPKHDLEAESVQVGGGVTPGSLASSLPPLPASGIRNVLVQAPIVAIPQLRAPAAPTSQSPSIVTISALSAPGVTTLQPPPVVALSPLRGPPPPSAPVVAISGLRALTPSPTQPTQVMAIAPLQISSPVAMPQLKTTAAHTSQAAGAKGQAATSMKTGEDSSSSKAVEENLSEIETFLRSQRTECRDVHSFVESQKEREDYHSACLPGMSLVSADDKSNVVGVAGESILQQVLSMLKQAASPPPSCHPHIKVEANTGLDGGALSPALLQVAREELKNLPIFRQERQGLRLLLHQPSLLCREYEAVGRLLGYMVTGCTGVAPKLLAPIEFAIIAYGADKVQPHLCDLLDNALQTKLFRIYKSKNPAQLEAAVREVKGLADISGNPLPTANKYPLLENLIKYIEVHSKCQAYEQLAEGLQWAGALKGIREDPSKHEEDLVFSPQKLGASVLLPLTHSTDTSNGNCVTSKPAILPQDSTS